MTFAGVNYWAILIAAVVAWLAGGVWYTTLGKPWMAAQGFTPKPSPRRKSGRARTCPSSIRSSPTS